MWHDLFLVSPILVVIVLGLVALLAAVFTPKGTFKGWLGYVTAFGYVLGIAATIFLWKQPPEGLAFTTSSFQKALVLDHFALAMTLVILAGALFITLSSVHYLPEQKADHGEFYGLVSFATAGMIALVMAADFLTFFIALELMSISVYILAGFKRQSKFSTESAMKYFVLGSFASGLLLMGIAFVYGATGEVTFAGVGQALTSVDDLPIEIAKLGMLLIVGAFFFKVAAAPFHMWTPDVYEGAPSTAAGFMAVAVKTAAFGGFARLMLTAFGSPEMRFADFAWEELIVIGAVLSMTIGNLMALAQKNLKRMLAYSAIAHTGYLFLALVVVPQDGEAGLNALGGGLVFYLLAYTLANAAAFGVAAAVSGADVEDVNEASYAGLAKRSPGLALVLAIAMLSLLGIPLPAGFMGKLTIFGEVLDTRGDYLWLVIVAVVNSVISAWYYLRVILVAYMQDESAQKPIRLITSRPLAVSVGLAAAATIVVGLLPSKALGVSTRAGMSLARTTVPMLVDVPGGAGGVGAKPRASVTPADDGHGHDHDHGHEH
ncbi:MAG: NADH-quinone oxidoreductase subunit N [Deltaproteobacteria bacterium]|nr:NADH-quinone oxidoreductase subunit N [Deltaproteobacteria bacterium]